MKTYGGVNVYIHIFLTSALEESGQLHGSAALPPGKNRRYPLERGLVNIEKTKILPLSALQPSSQ
jgi:hypothetical protein